MIKRNFRGPSWCNDHKNPWHTINNILRLQWHAINSHLGLPNEAQLSGPDTCMEEMGSLILHGSRTGETGGWNKRVDSRRRLSCKWLTHGHTMPLTLGGLLHQGAMWGGPPFSCAPRDFLYLFKTCEKQLAWSGIELLTHIMESVARLERNGPTRGEPHSMIYGNLSVKNKSLK